MNVYYTRHFFPFRSVSFPFPFRVSSYQLMPDVISGGGARPLTGQRKAKCEQFARDSTCRYSISRLTVYALLRLRNRLCVPPSNHLNQRIHRAV